MAMSPPVKPAMICSHRVTATHKHKGRIVRVQCVHCGATLPISEYGDSGKLAGTAEPRDS